MFTSLSYQAERMITHLSDERQQAREHERKIIRWNSTAHACVEMSLGTRPCWRLHTGSNRRENLATSYISLSPEWDWAFKNDYLSWTWTSVEVELAVLRQSEHHGVVSLKKKKFCQSFTSNFPFPFSFPFIFLFLSFSLRPFVCAKFVFDNH